VHADNIDERIIGLGGISVSGPIGFREVAYVRYEDEDKNRIEYEAGKMI
jgi:hypothetical protein